MDYSDAKLVDRTLLHKKGKNPFYVLSEKLFRDTEKDVAQKKSFRFLMEKYNIMYIREQNVCIRQ